MSAWGLVQAHENLAVVQLVAPLAIEALLVPVFHAGVSVPGGARERAALKRLCRYVTRLALVATRRRRSWATEWQGLGVRR